MLNQKKQKMTSCEETRLLMIPIWDRTPGITDEEKLFFESHLIACQKCFKEYEETKELMSLVKEHWGLVGTETEQLLEKAGYEVLEQKHVLINHSRPMAVEEGWKELCRRCPELAESTNKSKSLQLFLRIGTVAACLVIGVLTWMIFTNHSKQQILSQNIVSPQAATAPEPSVKVELIKQTGNVAIDASQAIVTNKELKVLLINDKHQMVMNVGTSLSIEPLNKNAQLGCLVKLTIGEIYTHVEHDGNPFIVGTANGQAVITGTTFDVKATKDCTTLIVSKGTVLFESKKGTVNVEADQRSKITGKSAPSIPLSCSTYELTAWATGYKPNTALAQDRSNDIDLYLSLSRRTDPIVLAKTDYDYWVNEKRNWFKTNFPWIFELKDALVGEGIEVDYPELLIKTDDVWQFVYLQKFPGRFSVPVFESLMKTAAFYGFDKDWLLENVPMAKLIQDKSLLSENPTGLDALDQLLKYVKGTEAMLYYLYPADAGRYLTETRSLIWFAIDSGQFELTNEQRTEVLDLLQQEVIAATNCFNDLLYPEDEKEKPLHGDVCETPEMRMVGYIETIKVIEEKIVKYEVIE